MKLFAAALLSGWLAVGQTAPPAFEVADVRPANPANPIEAGKGRELPGGRLELAGMTLNRLIMFALNVQENMIVGAPKWAGTQGFDIVAKAAPNTPQPMMQLMMQTLLADRFKLAFHREDRPMPAYVLTVGKHDSKLTPGGTPGVRHTCQWINVEAGLRRRECHNMTMADLAFELPQLGGAGLDRQVVDETGLKGSFDFQFEMGRPDTGPDIFMALEQIGLKLESRKMPLPTLVIDHAESPGDSN